MVTMERAVAGVLFGTVDAIMCVPITISFTAIIFRHEVVHNSQLTTLVCHYVLHITPYIYMSDHPSFWRFLSGICTVITLSGEAYTV